MKNPLLPRIFFPLLFLSGFSAYAQGLQLQWINQITVTGSASSSEIAIDAQKNMYITGGFTGTADFDPGSGTVNITSDTAFGKGNRFLAKYDVQGKLVWVRQLSHTNAMIKLLKSGDIILAGSFSGREDFDPGAGIEDRESAGSNDMFVAKYSPDGNFLTVIAMGGEGIDLVRNLTIDAAGNVYITGNFTGTADLDPSAGTVDLVSRKDRNIFFAKYTSDLDLLYAKCLPGVGNGSHEGISMAVDKQGILHLAARFYGSIDVDPGQDSVKHFSTNTASFIGRYDGSGNYLSADVYLKANVYYIFLDDNGNKYVTGTMIDSLDADPGPGKAMIKSSGILFDTWIAKYDGSGNYVYASCFDGVAMNNPLYLTANQKGSAYLLGRFEDSIDLDPSGAGGKLTGTGDAYLARFDASGNLNFTTTMGFDGPYFRSIETDQQGSVWIAGTFDGTVDFDPEAGVSNLTASPVSIFFGRYLDPGAVGISPRSYSELPVNIYSSGNKVFVDFSALETVDATVSVVNMLGQTITQTRFTESGRLQMMLPDMPAQVCLVIVSNAGVTVTRKILVD